MPTDYSRIREENIRRYGTETAHLKLLGDLYSDRTHFIFELLQNSEDAKATNVLFRLSQDCLELQHNGRLFTPDDVRGVSSVCQSTNQGDPERIGRFGIGFQSVYAYTRQPEIHSGEEHFAIEHYVRPEAANPRQPDNGHTTLIVLPFNAPAVVSAQQAQSEIIRAFRRLDSDTLLFLRHIQRVDLSVDGKSLIAMERKAFAQPEPWIRIVALRSSHSRDREQRWLLFERPVKLVTNADREIQVRVEVAFALTVDSSEQKLSIVSRDRAALAVFFPTEWKTSTGFIFQGPYLPTPARDNIRKNDPTNMQLANGSAELVVDALRWLRDQGALTTDVLGTLPLKKAEFPDESLLRPVFDRVLTAFKEEQLLPGYSANPDQQVFVEGRRAKVASSTELRELLSDAQLVEVAGSGSWSWLADGLSVRGDADLARYLRKEVGIQEVTASDFVSWLETKDADWWKGLGEAWLIRAYLYLHSQTSQHPRLRKLPIVRLESGEHMIPGYNLRLMSVTDPSGISVEGPCIVIVARDAGGRLHFRVLDGNGKKVADKAETALPHETAQIEALKHRLASLWDQRALTSDQKRSVIETVTSILGHTLIPSASLVFFPAENADEKKELAPFLSQLPIICGTLLKEDKDKCVESFLRQMGVVPLNALEFIYKCIAPRYTDPIKVTVEENRSHIRFLKGASTRMSANEFNSMISQLQKLPILVCHKASDPTQKFLVKPAESYLPASYSLDATLETFFGPSPGAWFVDTKYFSESEKPEEWKSFLIRMGVADLPRVTETEQSQRTDRHVDGLDAAIQAMPGLPDEKRLPLAKAVWGLVTRLLPGDSEYAEYSWEPFLHGREGIYGPRGGYYGSRATDVGFFVTLRDKSWMPDDSGVPRQPASLFEDTNANRDLLGDAVFYIHRNIRLKTKRETWLGDKLGVRRRPNAKAVLDRLKKFKSEKASLNDVIPLYEFFAKTGVDVAEDFEEGDLIFCPDATPQWRPPSQVFWDDESAVFGATRGYLKKHYPKLREFFLEIGVPQAAGPSDYVDALSEIAKTATVDEAVCIRIHRVYKRLAPRLEEDGDWQNEETWQTNWSQLKSGRNWLGRKLETFGFFRLTDLVRVDNEHLAELFRDKLPFWPFLDLTEFATQLGIAPCSSADCRFKVEGEGEVAAQIGDGLRGSWSLVVAFLRSERWKNDVYEGAEAALAKSPTVRLAKRIAVTCELKGASVEEPDSKESVLDSEKGVLWLAPKQDENEDELVEALGDALQEFFGPEVLREFVCDLFRKGSNKTADKWRKKGLILSQPQPPEQEEPDTEPAVSEDTKEARGPGEKKSDVGELRATNQRPSPTAPPTESRIETKGGSNAGAGERSASTGMDAPHHEGSIADGSASASAPSLEVQPTPQSTQRQIEQRSTPRKVDPVGSEPEKGVQKTFNDSFNKAGASKITDERPKSGAIRNPGERRVRTRNEYATSRRNEPTRGERVTRQVVDVWDPKNKAIRDFLYEEYAGRCQICDEINRFPRRDGKAFFEAIYLIPHAEAFWTDKPGSVICLCALCSAKFQHGTVECPDVEQQIRALKVQAEGGDGKLLVHLKLVGKPVELHFSERHLIEVQELLKEAGAEGAADADASTATSFNTAPSRLVECPKCHNKMPSGSLEKHKLRKHKGQFG